MFSFSSPTNLAGRVLNLFNLWVFLPPTFLRILESPDMSGSQQDAFSVFTDQFSN